MDSGASGRRGDRRPGGLVPAVRRPDGFPDVPSPLRPHLGCTVPAEDSNGKASWLVARAGARTGTTRERNQQSSGFPFSRSHVPKSALGGHCSALPTAGSLLICCCLGQTRVGPSPFTPALRSSPVSLPEERQEQWDRDPVSPPGALSLDDSCGGRMTGSRCALCPHRRDDPGPKDS